jgi:hypothetical protein
MQVYRIRIEYRFNMIKDTCLFPFTSAQNLVPQAHVGHVQRGVYTIDKQSKT